MRAAVCREIGAPLMIEEVDVAAPGPSELLVDVGAVAICHSDIAYMDGSWNGALPAVYGHEAAGVVAAVGPGVTAYEPGDTVAITLVRSCGECFYCRSGATTICQSDFRLNREPPLQVSATGEELWQAMSTGAFAEQVLVHESQVAAVPDSMSMQCAALLACGVVTGFGAVTNTARVPAGATVAVVGVGGVGLNCIQGATHCEASQVIAVDVRDDKLRQAMALGATATVNSATQDAAAEVATLTAGRGADYVFVAVGNSRVVEHSLPLLRKGGTLTIVGLPPTGDLVSFDPTEFAVAEQRLLGAKLGSVDVAHDIPQLAAMYERGDLLLDELITGTYRLDDINAAIASTKSGEAIRNVIVF